MNLINNSIFAPGHTLQIFLYLFANHNHSHNEYESFSKHILECAVADNLFFQIIIIADGEWFLNFVFCLHIQIPSIVFGKDKQIYLSEQQNWFGKSFLWDKVSNLTSIFLVYYAIIVNFWIYDSTFTKIRKKGNIWQNIDGKVDINRGNRLIFAETALFCKIFLLYLQHRLTH